jgi:hypothetical protein
MVVYGLFCIGNAVGFMTSCIVCKLLIVADDYAAGFMYCLQTISDAVEFMYWFLFSSMDNTWDHIDDGTQHGFTAPSFQQCSQYVGSQMHEQQQQQPFFEVEVICMLICVILIAEPIMQDAYVYIGDRVIHKIRFLRLQIIRILSYVSGRKEKGKGRVKLRTRANPREPLGIKLQTS